MEFQFGNMNNKREIHLKNENVESDDETVP
jgi:hypothetical protein